MILKVPHLYNTATRSKEPLKTLQEGEVLLYCCGPTVYARAHIGNLRTYIFEDLLCRTLRLLGYQLRHVMNITDIGHLSGEGDDGEDKIVSSARQQGTTVGAIAQRFMDLFFADADSLNIKRPSIVCRATDHITDMINLIQRLLDCQLAYRKGGNVYFDTARFPQYGAMAHLNLQMQQAGARVAIDSNKRSEHDFVLWFTKSKFEKQAMRWKSPWGMGYPGWHIECSAMSMRWLGEQFDIHCGGVDHIAVHHTNEIAQSEGAIGRPWVRYWLHGEFLLMGQEKMAKSQGGTVSLDDLSKIGFDPLDYRYLCLGAHYRRQLHWSHQTMYSAQQARHKLQHHAQDLLQRCGTAVTLQSEELSALAARYYQNGIDALVDDLNAPQLLAQLWGICRDRGLAASEQLALILHFDQVLGLSLGKARLSHSQEEDQAEIETLIAKRNEARQKKDWSTADAIRHQLAARNVILEDSSEGTLWRRESVVASSPSTIQ